MEVTKQRMVTCKAVISIVTKTLKKKSNFRRSLSNQAKFENTSYFHNPFSLYITSFLCTSILVMHWISWPWMRAKVYWRVSFCSRRKKCYQLPCKILDKLIYNMYSIYKTIRYTLYIRYTNIRWRPPVCLR